MNKWCFLILILSLQARGQSNDLRVADSLFSNGNYGKAIEAYTLLNDSEVYEKLALAFTALGNYQKGMEAYEMMIKNHPENHKAKYDYGKLLLKTKHFEKASSVFNDLINVDYRNPEYHYQAGLVLEELRDSTAINRFHAAYDLNNDHQKAIFKVAKHYLQKGQLNRSKFYIDKGLASYPNNVELISLKAQNYYWEKNYKESIKWFEQLLTLGESSEFIYEKLSESYAAAYEFEKAIEYRQKLLKLNPNDLQSYALISLYYKNLNKWTEAEEYQRKYLLLMDVSLSDDYKNLGIILNHQKKYKEAIDVFNKSLEEDPMNENAAFFKAMSMSVYYADNNSKIAAFESFKKRFPESKMIQSADFFIKKIRDEEFMKGESKKDSVSID
ncbi:tetratricopeptide repeat protein [Aegicerativicinus sediminis]|uniref:tetratricopeptide repeat protein n=1 Tax=Aegicerativicinus sediminis TaxID=2893202 RepID=UPI001E614975|nr:tetratricopeptide repeat protein [Aegicerativicinus sediminis]